MWTNPMVAGNSKTIGFSASVDQSVTPEISNIAFSVVEIEALEINWDDDTDTDGDGLPDVCEKYIFGTDINNPDTDGDGLPDGYEVTTSYTDPAKPDTDDNGVNDSEEDFDEDGLTNLEEFIRGTDPYNADTDNDGLSDGDEVNIYITDPLVADTDEDGLSDGDEILLGTNPLVRDTDGNGVIDSKEKFHQTFTHKVENEDCVITDVIVDMDCTGNINRTTSAESIMNTDIMCTEVVGLVGEPFEIVTSSEFDKSTLTFKVDKEKLGDIPLDRLLFLWYNEEENRFEELETVIDAENSSVSTITTHFSKYMVVDCQEWFDNWREIYDRFEKMSEENPSITAICVDCSGSMGWNDPYFSTDEFASICGRSLAVRRFCDAMFEKDQTSIITFDNYARKTCAFTSDKELLKRSATFYEYGGTNANAAIALALNELPSIHGNRSIILLSDGDVNVLDNNIRHAQNDKVKIHTIGLGSESDNAALKEIAYKTGGEFFVLKNADELEKIYDKISADNQLDFDGTSDNDDDGVPDDIEISGIPIPNGRLFYTNPNERDTDKDGLSDGDEVGKMQRVQGFALSTPAQAQAYKFFFHISSNPAKADSDNDGFYDGINGEYKPIGYYQIADKWPLSSEPNKALYHNNVAFYQKNGNYYFNELDFPETYVGGRQYPQTKLRLCEEEQEYIYKLCDIVRQNSEYEVDPLLVMSICAHESSCKGIQNERGFKYYGYMQVGTDTIEAYCPDGLYYDRNGVTYLLVSEMLNQGRIDSGSWSKLKDPNVLSNDKGPILFGSYVGITFGIAMLYEFRVQAKGDYSDGLYGYCGDSSSVIEDLLYRNTLAVQLKEELIYEEKYSQSSGFSGYSIVLNGTDVKL